MIEIEEFRDIPGYEGVYEVSNLGRVKNVETGRILKPTNDKDGYLKLVLSKNGTRKDARVHRLVALSFLPNPNNYPQVNHRDEDKTNNTIDNLEWCDAKYNMNYGTRTERVCKPVLQFSKTGEFIREYESGVEAERITGINRTDISSCCLELPYHKSAGGYLWRFKN